MRKLPTRLPHSKAAGFALIENMIAIVLFTTGALGIAVSTASAIKVNGDNQARAMALSVATKKLESIYLKANKTVKSPAEVTKRENKFAAKLRGFVAKDAVLDANQNVVTAAFGGKNASGNQAAGAKDDFTVSIIEALDSSAVRKNVLTTGGPYVSPITVAVRVTYTGIAGGSQDLKKAQVYYASFTYVLPKSVVAP